MRRLSPDPGQRAVGRGRLRSPNVHLPQSPGCAAWGSSTTADLRSKRTVALQQGEESVNTNKTTRRIVEQFNEAFNHGDFNAAANCFAVDCENHGRRVGRAGVRKVLAEIRTNFPDARLTILNSVAEGEWVVVRCTYSGTHRGTSNFPVDGGMLVGVPPTGHSFEVQHMHMYRILEWEDCGTLCEPRRCRHDEAARPDSTGCASLGSIVKLLKSAAAFQQATDEAGADWGRNADLRATPPS